ncbi:hypothetical protein Tco_1533709 [Tanacetum coccineum]
MLPKYRYGVAVAKGLKGYYSPEKGKWVTRSIHKIRVPINLYPYKVEERYPRKFQEYQRTVEEEEERRRELARIMAEDGKAKGDEGSREDNSDLESTGSNTPPDLEMDDVDSDDGN